MTSEMDRFAADLVREAVNLAEAFGPGPPHYGLTTNMDKWSDPIPFLLAVDAAAVAALALLGALLWRLRRG